MTVTPATNAVNVQDTISATKKSTLDYDAFLQLMVTQMQHQDPTAPVDMGEQMSQLASFSNVEQNIQTNAKLDALLSQMFVDQSTGLIGKTITVTENGEQVSGEVESVRIFSDGVVASLKDGPDVLVGPGVIVS